MSIDYSHYIEQLGLAKHPEGGYYKEIYRCPAETSIDQENRNLATSIYFLLTSSDVSKLHRLKSDEIWYYHAGAPLSIYLIHPDGKLEILKLGIEITRGYYPQAIIPAGCIFGAKVDNEDSFTLIGCMVSPGFDFKDFELPPREILLQKYPDHSEIIKQLT
ncbi:MAG TPA: cupin domain-containing protein [Cytophagaceae bacterium]